MYGYVGKDSFKDIKISLFNIHIARAVYEYLIDGEDCSNTFSHKNIDGFVFSAMKKGHNLTLGFKYPNVIYGDCIHKYEFDVVKGICEHYEISIISPEGTIILEVKDDNINSSIRHMEESLKEYHKTLNSIATYGSLYIEQSSPLFARVMRHRDEHSIV